MSRIPNYADVVAGTIGRVLQQDDRAWGVEKTLFADFTEELLTKYRVQYYVQDDFTVAALVRLEDRVTTVVGVSKRNITDPKMPLRGKSLALSRAIRKHIQNRLTELTEQTQKDLELQISQASNDHGAGHFQRRPLDITPF